MKMHCISNRQLTHFLKRESRMVNTTYELDLSAIFCDILDRANDFLPSEAGSIFLDDPVLPANKQPELVLITCFGDLSPRLVGMRLRASAGIVGHVYQSGRAYASSDPARDPQPAAV